MEGANIFGDEGGVWDVSSKNIFLADLSGSQYLFQILETSLTVQNSENVVKSGCFEKGLRWIFFKMKEGYKFSCVEISMFQ